VSVHGHYDRITMYTRVEDAPNVEARLAASMQRGDRETCVLAAKRLGSNLLFYGPATALTVWIVHAIWSIGWLVSGVVGLALMALAIQAAITFTLDLAGLPARVLTARGRAGFGWALLTLVLAAGDLAVTGGCFVLVGRAAEWWGVFT
jgi:hypothetical protein